MPIHLKISSAVRFDYNIRQAENQHSACPVYHRLYYFLLHTFISVPYSSESVIHTANTLPHWDSHFLYPCV